MSDLWWAMSDLWWAMSDLWWAMSDLWWAISDLWWSMSDLWGSQNDAKRISKWFQDGPNMISISLKNTIVRWRGRCDTNLACEFSILDCPGLGVSNGAGFFSRNFGLALCSGRILVLCAGVKVLCAGIQVLCAGVKVLCAGIQVLCAGVELLCAGIQVLSAGANFSNFVFLWCERSMAWTLYDVNALWRERSKTWMLYDVNALCERSE